MKLLLKNTLKKISKSIGRFISIVFIIALGISIFIGLRESTSGMLYTADNYYDENNLMDFKIYSTYGLDDEDIDAIKSLDHVDKVVPSYSFDVLSDGESIRIHALEDDINNVTLMAGKMPSNDNECLADYYNYQVGDIINFEGDNLSDSISISKCEVVGTIKSVLYIRNEKGISSVGNGKLVSFIYVKRSVFTLDYYTEVYITAKDSVNQQSYYSGYDKTISLLQTELEELKPIRETIRYEEVLKEATEKIISIKAELDLSISTAESQLASTKEELDSSKEELDNTKASTLEVFNSNYATLNNNKNTIISNLNSMDITEGSLDTYIKNLKDNIANLQEQLSTLITGSEEYVSLSNQITDLENNYNDLITIQKNLVSINNNLATLDQNYEDFENEIAAQEEKLNIGYEEYYSAVNELEVQKSDAEDKINAAKEELNSIEKPVWYLLDRTDNSGYISYKDDVVKVDSIARILPIFFAIVVVLMISNTLTRMIEEERTEMGILQATGFSSSAIIFSYLIYIFIAGLIGIGIGLTIGYSLIPKIIYGVFLSRYYVPDLIVVISPLTFTLVILVTLLLMIIVTVSSCYKELKYVPAELLRPKSPKSGKKVIFEKSKFIWKKLSFMWKITIRNLFRYKKRIIMTILGVSGCSALLLTAMGLNDSINQISKLQYNNIIKYDSMYILNNNVSSISSDLQSVFVNNNINKYLLINQSSYTFTFDNKTEDVYLIVPSKVDEISSYITLKSTISNTNVTIDDDGVIITEQMAKLLNLNVGDMISIRNNDNELFILYVSDIVENYVSHYIYMSPTYYKEIFNNDITYNTIITKGEISDEVELTKYNILTTNSTKDILATFDSFVSGLNKIILMIIIFACFLAFIVLYNLTIINISERKREIATFKVLGFYDKEIETFVYREIIILTILGIALGLFLGIYLHKYIIATSQTDTIMFLTKIKWTSFILASIITIIFSFIVQLIVNKSLKKIDMIESLKSVE